MKYVIYELVQPSHLKEIEYEGYYPKTVMRSVLQVLDVSRVNEEHSTFEDAVKEIENNTEHLKHKSLTILPVIDISYDGSLIK